MSKWETVKLIDVCKDIFAGGDVPKNNYSLKKDDNYSIPIYTNGEQNLGLYGYTTKARVIEPSITVSARGTIGFTAIRTTPFFPAIRLITLTPNDDIDIRYLFYVTQNYKFDNGGTSIPQLTVPMLKGYSFSLPPLDIQKQIAENLDKVTRTIDLCNAIIEKLDLLVKARFVEMFGEIESTVPLSFYIESLSAGKSLAGEEECENKVLKTGAVTYDYFDGLQVKNLPLDYEPLEEHRVKNDDVIISRMNTLELVGAAAYVWKSPLNTYLPDRLWRANLKQNVNPIFIWQILIQQTTRDNIRKIASGTSGSMKNISKTGLLGIKVIEVPSMLQDQFANFVKQTEKSKLAVKQVLEKAETLKKALMQEYFG
ncbi:MAG: restriction endonuclease subunit S [Oscillospiraceae bacterium]|nr:restriction endonuclease subunit S [Oscillospiraceae bacterium]